MKRTLIFLLGVLLTIGFQTGANGAEAKEKSTSKSNKPMRLKLMTYNIRIGIGGGEWNGNPTNINLEPVAKIISEHTPDFVGLEEVDRFRKRSGGMNQPKWLSERLSLNVAFQPAYTVPVPGKPEEAYGIGLLSLNAIQSSERFALFKPDYSKTHPEYPDYYSEQRALLHAQVVVDSRLLHVFVTHLGLTADQREKQIRQIAETMARYKGPKILLGDFNASPDDPEMVPLFREYRDALGEAGVRGDARKSFPVGEKSKEAIDYIFLSKDFHVVSAQVIRDTSLASDHNPVIAEVELP